MDQRELRRGEGPIALVMVPTRELALQIYTETKRYCKVYNIEVMMKCFNLTFNNTRPGVDKVKPKVWFKYSL